MRRNKGFTLVELMTVICLVAVLAAMVVPSLARARGQADQVKCESNLRQILLAASSYENDSEGLCPWPNWIGPELAGYRPQGWLYQYPKGVGPSAAASDATSGILYSRLGTLGVYRCPDDTGPFYAGPTQLLTSYLMNGATCGYGRHLPAYHITAFPANAIMFWEVTPLGETWSDGAIYPSQEIAARHNNGGSVGCYDGHVEWLSVTEFATEEEKLPGRLWCDPGSSNGT